ncbi:MAG TPA: response regulator [Planctomycetota bacterium]|nr:response regulator [Planctomycetota bacterium]
MQHCVLVVDDDLLVRWSLKQALTARGFQVLEAGSGREALQLAQEQRFEGAVIDWSLPDTDGLALLVALAQACPGCRLLLLTAYLSEDLTARALQSGAAQVLGKPFEVDDIATRVAAEVHASTRMPR